MHDTLPSGLTNLSTKEGSWFVCQVEISQTMGHPTHPWYFFKNFLQVGVHLLGFATFQLTM